MTFLILPKIQNCHLQSFDIQPKCSSQNVCAHFLITKITVCRRNILNSLRKGVFKRACFQMANCDLAKVYGGTFLYIHIRTCIRTVLNHCIKKVNYRSLASKTYFNEHIDFWNTTMISTDDDIDLIG